MLVMLQDVRTEFTFVQPSRSICR